MTVPTNSSQHTTHGTLNILFTYLFTVCIVMWNIAVLMIWTRNLCTRKQALCPLHLSAKLWCVTWLHTCYMVINDVSKLLLYINVDDRWCYVIITVFIFRWSASSERNDTWKITRGKRRTHCSVYSSLLIAGGKILTQYTDCSSLLITWGNRCTHCSDYSSLLVTLGKRRTQ